MIRVEAAKIEERDLIEGMSRFYIYYFSETEPAESYDMDFDHQGGFGILPYLAEYWRESGRHPLLVRRGEKPVGFALINTHSRRGGRIKRNMGEFLVSQKYRRRGGRGGSPDSGALPRPLGSDGGGAKHRRQGLLAEDDRRTAERHGPGPP